jgi:hypothetical protein
MRRIDYIRAVDYGKPVDQRRDIGENPYQEQFRFPSEDEVRRMLNRIPSQPIGVNNLNAITHKYIRNSFGFNFNHYADFRAGRPSSMGRKRLQRLGRFLQMVEAGQITRTKGVIVYVDDPPPKPREVRFHVELRTSTSGRLVVTLRPGEPPKAQKLMPNLFKDLSLPKARA